MATSRVKTAKQRRKVKPTGVAVAFLGPDGSGKSTVIKGLIKEALPFSRTAYFHLKPIQDLNGRVDKGKLNNPHGLKPYSRSVSYLKLFYFVLLYNYGWLKNILSLKAQSSLIIFDRYYDDLLVDPKRYRLRSNRRVGLLLRSLIPRPSIYFILTTEADVIYKRKQEVSYNELKRQITEYSSLADNKRYFQIDVNRKPEEIIRIIKQLLLKKINESY